MLDVDVTAMAVDVVGNQVDVLLRVGPTAKDEGAVLLAPRPVLGVEAAEGSVNHRGHKNDVTSRHQDDL